MHALAFLSLVASTALVAAQDEYASFQPLSTFSTLQARQQQSCASVGGKTCGTKCIRLSYTCCGNGAGACEVGYTCGLAANGIYGCCPLGKRCRGDAPDPSTTDIGVARPTTVRGGGAGGVDDDDDDETTSTRAVETTTRRLTPTNTPARTTAISNDDETTTSSSTTTSTTSRSTSTTRSSAVALGTSSSSVNGAGSDSNGNGNANGSGSSSTAGSGGSGSQASSAGIISVGLASLAGGFIAAIASLL
ncbi:GPI anchored serine-threonine rich protein [Beauveria bassiana ARSEF 2860]|uniref:GPI anchored serine-threonine rich protein n=1 Tax=Beauveria bassiana (strain ARSEF 2860) TaxID=655819 RepID=J5JWU3_BEAB2|nr:GPI anchored serine-threonine rich protein [Beauveria bassiana ARSEF 2860]EJP66766.1 GPI anchored serine-threonine rich protein [Beauveria bassiana ARSEF 2860]